MIILPIPGFKCDNVRQKCQISHAAFCFLGIVLKKALLSVIIFNDTIHHKMKRMKMKKLIFLLIVFLVVSGLEAQSALGNNAVGNNANGTGPTLFVTAKTAEVKDSSSFFAKVLGTLALGDSVTVQQNLGKWMFVRSDSGLQGWAPADAFSSRRTLKSGSGVSASEFALAGKGFSSDLENILRSSGEVDYSGVDVMEKRTVSPEDLRLFLKEGRLAEGE